MRMIDIYRNMAPSKLSELTKQNNIFAQVISNWDLAQVLSVEEKTIHWSGITYNWELHNFHCS